jgi:S-(hydroxymethyl)glutathione dehydrogenase/alcohol dehydrogenase
MLVKTMKAAILVESRQPLVVDEVELPDALAYGQVLVKVHYSGICASQIHEIDATKGPDKYLPHLLGHEGSATVLETGPGVRFVKPGDHVVMHWKPGAGIQSDPPKYRWRGQTLNAGWVTTFNEYAVVSENRLTPIPSDFDLRVAPLFGCAVTTGFGVVNNDAQVKIGQSVAVFGVGGVGLCVVQAAALCSAYPIVAVDIHDSKLEMAKQFGATHGFNSRTCGDLDAAIREVAGARGVDAAIETTGVAKVIEQAYELTQAEGKTILVGVPRVGDKASIYTLPLHFNKVLKGSHGGGTVPQVDIPNYVRLMKCGRLQLDKLLTHRFQLSTAQSAIDYAREGIGGRISIDCR